MVKQSFSDQFTLMTRQNIVSSVLLSAHTSQKLIHRRCDIWHGIRSRYPYVAAMTKMVHDNSSDIHWHKLKSIGVLYNTITFENIILFWHSFWCSCECYVSVSKLSIYKSIYLRMKRVASTTANTITNKKRKVGYPTFQNWKHGFDREFKTLSWLECETKVEEGSCVVTQLKCSMCTKFCSRSDSM